MSALVGQPKDFTLTAKDALGLDVDVAKFPSALTNVAWTTSDPMAVVVPGSGGAVITFGTEGAIVVTVVGNNKAGDEVRGSTEVVVEMPVPLVVSLVVSEA